VFILVVSSTETRPSHGSNLCGHYADGATHRNPLKHDPEKWVPVFRLREGKLTASASV
jgi:hypothetical protein